MHFGDFTGVGFNRDLRTRPNDDRRDAIAGPGGIIIEKTQNMLFSQFNADFFVHLA